MDIDTWLKSFRADAPLSYAPISYRFEYAPSAQKKTSHNLAAGDAIRRLVENNGLSDIKKELESLEAEQKAKTQKVLEAALLVVESEKADSRRFYLAVQQAGKGVTVLTGVEYPDDRTDKSEDDYVDRVYVFGLESVFGSTNSMRSVDALKERLTKYDVPFALKYID